jgi:hypothetical protein
MSGFQTYNEHMYYFHPDYDDALHRGYLNIDGEHYFFIKRLGKSCLQEQS